MYIIFFTVVDALRLVDTVEFDNLNEFDYGSVKVTRPVDSCPRKVGQLLSSRVDLLPSERQRPWRFGVYQRASVALPVQ